MIGAVLQAGGLDPTIIVGGRVDALGANARHGKSRYLVAEADESDRSFLKLSPIIEVVTNIDREHLDTYRDLDDIEQTFLDFMDRVPFYGTVVLCLDDDRLRDLLPNVQRRVVTYGTRADSDFLISDIETSIPNGGPASCFRVHLRGQLLGEFHLHVPGVHNVLNAGAAIAVGTGLEIPAEQIIEALRSFGGVDRRFQLRGRAAGVNVVDDYGHHPTEIKATLAAARQCGFDRIHVIFQPHRYTRTEALLNEFGTAFAEADSVFVLDIYAASEPPIEGINGELVAKKIGELSQRQASYLGSFAEAAEAAAAIARSGDLVLTLGAGNISQLGPMVLGHLQARTQTVGV
jgi:UDP-N-acetylmuramate--alanine ligase